MTYLRNCWYPAAWAEEVGREPMARTLLGEPVMLYRTKAGEAVALEDRCCHKFMPLSLGRIKEDCVECGYHGMTFDASGACVRIPGQANIPANARVRSYPLAEHLGLVWIWPGEPDLADQAKLFELPEYDKPGWGVNKGPYTYIKTNYRNLTDNLLDPAHVSFVHLSTLGSADMEDIPVETSQDGTRVEVRRWTLDMAPVPIFEKFGDFKGNVDRWQYYLFYPPSVNVVDFGAGPVGMEQSEEAREANVRIHSCHFMAPETETSTHYFWMQARNFQADDEAISRQITEQFVMAFEEDREILEAVQASEDACPGRPQVKLLIDRGPSQSRRIVDKMIRKEQQEAAQAAE
ncbi:MAG: aromatic ring-hydroxylating dioxygenase subunit alpha [Alphaproteobacteria bacterium]